MFIVKPEKKTSRNSNRGGEKDTSYVLFIDFLFHCCLGLKSLPVFRDIEHEVLAPGISNSSVVPVTKLVN